MKNAFVVLGMHRSGTSSVAGVLALLGATPPRTLMGPKPDNPRGFWESEVLMTFNDEILAQANSSWSDPEPLNPAVFEGASGRVLRERAAQHLVAEFGDAEIIVLKDPRICRFYPFWREVLIDAGYNPRVVIPIRRPAEVAASLEARNALPINQGMSLWRRHVQDAEGATQGELRHIMALEDFLSDWRVQVQAMARTFDLPASPDEAVSAEIDTFLARNPADAPSRALQEPDEQTARVYGDLLAQARAG